MASRLAVVLTLMVSMFLAGCGSGAATADKDGAPSAAEVAAITPTQLRAYSDEQIIALGTNIKYLSDEALAALTLNNSATTGQIAAITAEQIVVLSPAQVRLLGAAGEGGSITTSKVAQLNTGAWAALVENQEQVAAFLPDEIPTFSPAQIVALGTNIQYLSDDALTRLTLNNSATTGQIAAITVKQIVVLSPAQVRLLGAAGEGGSITTSKVGELNTGAWAALVENQEQVAAFLPDEIPTFSPAQIVALGTNIQYLSDDALTRLTLNNSATTGQIAAITVKQVVVLTPAQVRLLGAAGEGGSITTSKVGELNTGAWAALVENQEQVAAFLADEIPTFLPSQIAALGTNIQYLSDDALAAFTPNNSAAAGQIAAITAKQMVVLSPEQVAVLAAISDDKGLSFLNEGALQSLTADQIAVLTAAQLASLSPDQHTACGC